MGYMLVSIRVRINGFPNSETLNSLKIHEADNSHGCFASGRLRPVAT